MIIIMFVMMRLCAGDPGSVSISQSVTARNIIISSHTLHSMNSDDTNNHISVCSGTALRNRSNNILSTIPDQVTIFTLNTHFDTHLLREKPQKIGRAHV